MLHGPFPDGPPPGRGGSARGDDLLRPLGHPRRQLPILPQRIPKLDMALSTLVEDLYHRGLDKDVSVVVWGEFGRTPKINKDAGRDHWPPVNFALLAGGGMRTGQVIGSTDRDRGLRQGSPGHIPERLRHALPQPRHRPPHSCR